MTLKLSNYRSRNSFIIFFTIAITVAAMFSGSNQAAATENDIAPAPASIGSDIPLTYFGPAPSQVQRELIGPYQLLKSGQIDIEAGTITLPLYQGRLRDGQAVWYVLTDIDDRGNADALGLNWSAKLTYAGVDQAVRNATLAPEAKINGFAPCSLRLEHHYEQYFQNKLPA